jgi:hypothetical protein
MTYALRHKCVIEVPKFGSTTGEKVNIQPNILESTWSRNSHVEADELTLVLDMQSGVDPRLLKNSRVLFYLWDDMREDFDIWKHLRFVGICRTAKRTGGDDKLTVEMSFQDFTALFIEHKALPAAFIPDWTDTIESAWKRICSGTGWWDSAQGKIVSSVDALRDRMVFRLSDDTLRSKTIGSSVPPRFHEISKPSPPPGATSWTVFQYCVGCLGLMAFIERDQIVVTESSAHYAEANAARLTRGRNVLTFSEEADQSKAAKAVLLKSFDPLAGRVIEAIYPELGDPRIKTRRAAAFSKKALVPTENDVANDADQYNVFWITDIAALHRRAKEAYEETSRQELQGQLTTSDLDLTTTTGEAVDLLGLVSGDAIEVALDDVSPDVLRAIGPVQDRVAYLESFGYAPDMARLIADNVSEKLRPIYHVSTITTNLTPDSFLATVTFHNLIR